MQWLHQIVTRAMAQFSCVKKLVSWELCCLHLCLCINCTSSKGLTLSSDEYFKRGFDWFKEDRQFWKRLVTIYVQTMLLCAVLPQHRPREMMFNYNVVESFFLQVQTRPASTHINKFKARSSTFIMTYPASMVLNVWHGSGRGSETRFLGSLLHIFYSRLGQLLGCRNFQYTKMCCWLDGVSSHFHLLVFFPESVAKGSRL